MAYTHEEIPQWCKMPQPEHQAFGGCWLIALGDVQTAGKRACEQCEHCGPEDGRLPGTEIN